MSPGGLLGQGSDVITPLNVRDPSALIMGPGAAQKPSAVIDAPAASSKGDSSAWKDALAAAQKGAATATRKASLPVPHPKLAAGLRGLGAIGGGSAARTLCRRSPLRACPGGPRGQGLCRASRQLRGTKARRNGHWLLAEERRA